MTDVGWVTGVNGGGLEFDGVVSHVSVADNVALDFSGWSGYTVALWARADQLGT